MSGEASHDSGRHFFKYRAFDGRQTEPVLLVASPHLTDDHFKKTVVLMLEHHSQGAIGMILNRPTRVRVSTAFQSPRVYVQRVSVLFTWRWFFTPIRRACGKWLVGLSR